LRKLENK